MPGECRPTTSLRALCAIATAGRWPADLPLSLHPLSILYLSRSHPSPLSNYKTQRGDVSLIKIKSACRESRMSMFGNNWSKQSEVNKVYFNAKDKQELRIRTEITKVTH